MLPVMPSDASRRLTDASRAAFSKDFHEAKNAPRNAVRGFQDTYKCSERCRQMLTGSLRVRSGMHSETFQRCRQTRPVGLQMHPAILTTPALHIEGIAAPLLPHGPKLNKCRSHHEKCQVLDANAKLSGSSPEAVCTTDGRFSLSDCTENTNHAEVAFSL